MKKIVDLESNEYILIIMIFFDNFNLWISYFLKLGLISVNLSTHTQVNSNPIKKLFSPHTWFSKNLYSVGCSVLQKWGHATHTNHFCHFFEWDFLQLRFGLGFTFGRIFNQICFPLSTNKYVINVSAPEYKQWACILNWRSYNFNIKLDSLF